MSKQEVFANRIMLTDETGNPLFKTETDSAGNETVKLNAAGDKVQDSIVKYYTEANGKGTLVKSVMAGMAEDGSIIYYDRVALSDTEIEVLKTETAHRFFLDRYAPNAKDEVVLKKGLIHRFEDLADNIIKKARNPQSTIDARLAKGIMYKLMTKMAEVETAVMQVKVKKATTERCIGLDDVLQSE